MVNANALVERLDLNDGNPIRGPLRAPLAESSQFFSATERFLQALAYTSFEFSPHHGVPSSRTAATCLRRLKSLRKDWNDQDSAG